MADLFSSHYTLLMDLSTQLYELILKSQRGIKMTTTGDERADQERLGAEITSACSSLTAAISQSESTSRVGNHEEESSEDPGIQISRSEQSNAAGLCLYAQGLVLYSQKGSAARKESRAKLSESVKKAPSHLPAWLLLSHLHWERGDVSGAIRTINTGLAFSMEDDHAEEEGEGEGEGEAPPSAPFDFAHRVALQQLSMLVRQKGGSPGRGSPKLLQLSLDLASAAVQGDVSDGYSWYCLALAQLSSHLQLYTPLQISDHETFGTAGRRAKLLKQTLASFSHAEGNGMHSLADLYFNRAIIETYSQEFQLALNDYERAAALDKTLPTGAQVKPKLQK